MRSTITLIGVLFCFQIFGNNRPWSRDVYATGRGLSQQAAAEEAKWWAEKVQNRWASLCGVDGGTFSSTLSEPNCRQLLPHLWRCTVIGKVTCG